jgi:endonuclease G
VATASPAIPLEKVFDAPSCNQVLVNNGFFTTCYSYKYKSPSRCLSRLDGDQVNAVNSKHRQNFYADRHIPLKYRSYSNSYRNTGMDQGHTCASDASFDYSPQSLHATYAMSNISMQAPNSNRKSWLKIEKLGRLVSSKLGSLDTLTLVFFGNSPKRLGPDHVAVPVAYGRVLSNTSKNYHKCFYMPNDNRIYRLKEMQMDCGEMISKYEAQKSE